MSQAISDYGNLEKSPSCRFFKTQSQNQVLPLLTFSSTCVAKNGRASMPCTGNLEFFKVPLWYIRKSHGNGWPLASNDRRSHWHKTAVILFIFHISAGVSGAYCAHRAGCRLDILVGKISAQGVGVPITSITALLAGGAPVAAMLLDDTVSSHFQCQQVVQVVQFTPGRQAPIDINLPGSKRRHIALPAPRIKMERWPRPATSCH